MNDPVPSDTGKGRTQGQILIILVVVILLLNVPISYRGIGLIQSIPDATPVVIREGMILKGSGPEIYVLENYKLRRFDSPDVFSYFAQQYHLSVQLLDDQLLTQFESGRPIRYLVKCNKSPDVYALENGEKHLTQIMLASSPQTDRWDSVRLVACSYLGNMPNGSPILDE